MSQKLKGRKKYSLSVVLDEWDNDQNSKRKKTEDSTEEVIDVPLDPEDPFYYHFQKTLSIPNAIQVRKKAKWKSSVTEWPLLGRVMAEVPTVTLHPPKAKKLFEDDITYDPPRMAVLPSPPDKNDDILKYVHEFLKKRVKTDPTSLMTDIWSIISSYTSFYYPYSTHDQWDTVQYTYCLHCLNHVLKSNEEIIRHNKILSRKKEENFEFRDMGLTRPKVLVILPFKNSASKFINLMIDLLKLPVENKSQFDKIFASQDEEDDPKSSKEFKATFEGNIEEDFIVGIKIGTEFMTLFSKFLSSDIIVASPLALRFRLDEKSKETTEFFTSLEMLIVDQADILMMQNWEHMLSIRGSLNKMPTDMQAVMQDLYRIRHWSMQGLSDVYRQTIMVSSTPVDLHRVFMANTVNFAGTMEVVRFSSGVLPDLNLPVTVLLQRLNTSSELSASCPDTQFKYFTEEMLPMITERNWTHVLIYVPDYCDYIRVVTHIKNDTNFTMSSINEYMVDDEHKVEAARGLFYKGKRTLLVYTERVHFYRRFKIDGVRNIIFYGLPTFPHFFLEVCNFLKGKMHRNMATVGGRSSVLMPFQVHDATRLAAIVGNEKAEQMCLAEESAFKCALQKNK